jgi:dihydroorotase
MTLSVDFDGIRRRMGGMFDLCLRNSTLVTPDGVRPGHVAVEGGQIAAILEPGAEAPPARQTLDCRGLHVLAGVVDSHVHFREPGLSYKEDWDSGSRAAVCGGVTTVLDMPNVQPPTRDPAALASKLAHARGRSFVHFGLYGVIADDGAAAVEPLARAGVVGFKVFLGETVGGIPSPDDGALLAAMRAVAAAGLRVGVHAENNALLRWFGAQVRASGRRDPLAHPASRPVIAESEATSRAILLAAEAGCPLTVHHVSCAPAAEHVARARARGQDVVGETCPQYLLLTAAEMERLGPLMKINPPVREPGHDRALWAALREGALGVVASDHSPHTLSEKQGDIWQAAAGWPGVETLLPLMLTAAAEGRCTLPEVARWLCEAPAKTWGLWPRKGNLAAGADADLAVCDLGYRGRLQAEALHSKHRFTAFAGRELRARVVATIVAGEVAMRDGEVLGAPRGQWLRPA